MFGDASAESIKGAAPRHPDVEFHPALLRHDVRLLAALDAAGVEHHPREDIVASRDPENFGEDPGGLVDKRLQVFADGERAGMHLPQIPDQVERRHDGALPDQGVEGTMARPAAEGEIDPVETFLADRRAGLRRRFGDQAFPGPEQILRKQ